MQEGLLNRRDFLKSGSATSAGLALYSTGARTAAAAPRPVAAAGSVDLRFRQIHLDFHTSRHITGIGAEFDPDAFAETLQKAHVNSVTCFGRCHHGYIYHDTQFTTRRHPHLTRNLLKEQIDACHKRDIRVPIYVTVEWDHYTAREHPEWLQISSDGQWNGGKPYEAGFYRRLAKNSPYDRFLKEYIADLFEAVPVDGLFLDIVHPQDDSSKWTVAQMLAEDLDPANVEARRQFGRRGLEEFISSMTAYIRTLSRDCSIFYNSGHVGPHHRSVVDGYTHLELESLPSGGWGYLHLPLTARYARKMGQDFLGMTGKFHTSWGDFHSFKNQAALEFECFMMLALTGKCSVGDQLHPGGALDPHTYDLIGSVYSSVAAKEPWCVGARAVTDIGVVSPEEFGVSSRSRRTPAAAMGVVRMLQEGKHQFDMVDSQMDYTSYRVLILPDEIPVSGEFQQKLEAYMADGGSLIASFESGLDVEKRDFALSALGVRKVSDGPRDLRGQTVRGRSFGKNDFAEYIIPRDDIGHGLNATEHVMYIRGLDVAVTAGSAVLADITLPYFDRTFERFCSHRQTPSSGRTGGPAIVRNGRAIYFSHPIFTQYHANAPRWCRTMFLNALALLLPDPVLRVDAPTATVATINEQSSENRRVVHVLHYVPERRGQAFDIVEDVYPISDIRISVRVDQRVREVTLEPQGERLAFTEANGRVGFHVPRVDGHQMVAVTL